MHTSNLTTAIRTKVFGLLFFLVLAGTLTACLWPFQSPKNHVAWLAHGNGLRFGQYGTIVSQGVFKRPLDLRGKGLTVEIWLRPKNIWNRGTIFAFYDPHHSSGLSLLQSNGSFLVETGPWKSEDDPKNRKMSAGKTFGGMGDFRFLTITSGPQGARIYVDGVLVRNEEAFRIAPDALSGRMIVANSPVLPDGWAGDLKGLAFYNRAFTAAQVQRHYETWTGTGQVGRTDDGVVAIYLFDERSGSIIHNRGGVDDDLFIPKRYMELHHTLLRSPWDEYSPNWGYWKDVLLNIAGFVPLGFLCYAFLLSAGTSWRAALFTILFGCVLSVTVEVLQAYLPTRDSGITDIITNTLGTMVGIGFYRCARLISAGLMRSRYFTVRSLAGLFVDKTQPENAELSRVAIGR